jgi:hypothetical protein
MCCTCGMDAYSYKKRDDILYGGKFESVGRMVCVADAGEVDRDRQMDHP